MDFKGSLSSSNLENHCGSAFPWVPSKMPFRPYSWELSGSLDPTSAACQIFVLHCLIELSVGLHDRNPVPSILTTQKLLLVLETIPIYNCQFENSEDSLQRLVPPKVSGLCSCNPPRCYLKQFPSPPYHLPLFSFASSLVSYLLPVEFKSYCCLFLRTSKL